MRSQLSFLDVEHHNSPHHRADQGQYEYFLILRNHLIILIHHSFLSEEKCIEVKIRPNISENNVIM